MKMLTGLLPPTEGTALLLASQSRAGTWKPAGASASCPRRFPLYTELTVRQNLMLHARLFDLPRNKLYGRVEEMISRFGLESTADTLAGGLPLGIRQRLSLAVAVIHNPEMLILDEPTSGVDPVARDGFWELLIQLSREQGVTIFISTHFMNEAERCDRISLMHAGKVLAQGTPAELKQKQGDGQPRRGIPCLSRRSLGNNQRKPRPTRRQRSRPITTRKHRTRRSTERFSLGRLWAFARREAVELSHDYIRLAFACSDLSS